MPGWLVQLVALVALLAVVGYEAIVITITTINLEDDAREVAQAAAQAYGARNELTVASDAASDVADVLEITLEQVEERGGSIRVDVGATAETLVVHRIGPLRQFAQASASGQAPWRP